MAGCTGTEVKRALTSNEVMLSPGCNLFSLYLLYEMLSVLEVMWRLAYQWFDYMGKFFCYPIGDGAPAGNNGPEWSTCFMDFREPIKFGWDGTCWV